MTASLPAYDLIPLPGEGPEDVVVGSDGLVYTGLLDGRILGVAPIDGAVREVAKTGPWRQQLAEKARARDILIIPLTVLYHHGVAFTYEGRVLFFLSEGDLDLQSAQTLDTTSQSVLKNLDDALAARVALSNW